MSEKEPTSNPASNHNRFSFFGRVDWVVPAGKSKDGLQYYQTQVTSPSSDPYDPPPRRVILSEGQFAKVGQEVNGFFSTSLRSRTADVTDKNTGEVTRRTFHSHDLWLVR